MSSGGRQRRKQNRGIPLRPVTENIERLDMTNNPCGCDCGCTNNMAPNAPRGSQCSQCLIGLHVGKRG